MLAGCALFGERAGDQRVIAEAALQQRVVALRGVTDFDLAGRVAVAGSPLSGALRWQQRDERFALRVAGPLGIGALQLEGTADRVRVRSGAMDFATSDPAGLLERRVGWPLPIAELRWWVLGVPAPGDGVAVEINRRGELLLLEQAGWQVRFDDYANFAARGPAAGIATPGRVEARFKHHRAVLIVRELDLAPVEALPDFEPARDVDTGAGIDTGFTAVGAAGGT